MNFELNLKDIITTSLSLFAVIDILGSTPVIIGMRQKIGHIESGKTTLTAGFLMILFLFTGDLLLGLFGIDIGSFAMAGSIVMFIIALEMILGIDIFRADPDVKGGSIVPIAFPIIAGSGTLTTIISLNSVYSQGNLLVAIILNLVIVFIVLKSTGWLERKIGKSGLLVMRKFFGIILLSIAVKIFKTYLKYGFD